MPSRLRDRLDLGAASASPALTALLLVGVLAVQLVMIGSYVGGLHAPKARDVPVAVVAPPALAGAAVARLDRGGALDGRPYDSLRAARSAVDTRKVYAIFVPGITPGRTLDRLIVAPAASPAVAELLTAALRRGEPAGRRLTVETVRPLPSDDPRGLSPFYLVVGWLVGGYIGATVLGLARGGSASGARDALLRLAALAGYAIASGLLGVLVVQQIVGVLEGSTLALVAAGALIVFATGAATAALQSLLGIAGTALAVLAFVAIGNPASGGPLATELLMPGLWRAVGPLLPPGAGTTLVRNIAYFDANALGEALAVLAAYAVVGSVIVAISGYRHVRGTAPAEATGAIGLAA